MSARYKAYQYCLLHFSLQQPEQLQQHPPDFLATILFLQRDFTINVTITNKITLTITVPIKSS